MTDGRSQSVGATCYEDRRSDSAQVGVEIPRPIGCNEPRISRSVGAHRDGRLPDWISLRMADR
jgi:hypothetical protein